MLGHDQFHDEEKLQRARSEIPQGQVSYIPDESGALRALAQVNQELVREIGRRCAEQQIATIDLDATIIESWKKQAKPTYQGGKGYQPMLAVWAEMDLVLPVARHAFQALPAGVQELYFRGDAACWERELVNWLRDEEGRQGPRGRITFGIRVRMTPNLKKHIRQGELFADGSEAKYFVVASNEWNRGAKKLLEWHREKAGTIEAVHDVLKNELAGGVMPCGRFGANAAWMRLALLTHNVLTALKRIGLPEPWLRSRPKRLRFQIFRSPAKLVHHARRVLLRVRRAKAQLIEWCEVWRLMPVAS
ncbi:MAG: hypothetical protein IANPNBLG_00004 [Bryobacteraceae bacterium]|nr:hypothetical protein [Bryobacteraceae bacterium]